MSTTNSLSNKQALDLIKGVNLSPALQKSKDSILLAEDQYPEHLDSIFGKTEKTTDLDRVISLLKWNRKTERGSLEKAVYDKMVSAQDGLRSTMQLTPTTDNPWEKHVYKDWKHRVTNICLTAVQEVIQSSERGSSSHHSLLFTPQDKTAAANANNYIPQGNKRNIEGLLMYHPLLVNDPWQAPDDLDRRIDDLLAETKTLLVQRSYNPWDQYDANKARAQLSEIKSAINLSLTRIYKYTSNSFHVLLKYLIPRADRSYLFTRVKGERMEHILRQREWSQGRRAVGAPALTTEQKKSHSASHTLAFIEENYVDDDDDAPHTTWDKILKATREPKMSIYNWVDSFTVRILRHTESTSKKLGKKKRIKVNKIIAKQITDDEKLIITTIDPRYTTTFINDGDYFLNQVISTLAQHTSSFASKKYNPSDHPRIMSYLRVRSRSSGTPLPAFLLSTPSRQKPSRDILPLKRKREHYPTQRSWSYLADMDHESYATATTHTIPGGQLKGKGKGKPAFKGKGKGKLKGKHNEKGKPMHVVWKGKGKGKGKPAFKGSRTTPLPQSPVSGIPQRPTDNSSITNTPVALGSTSQPIRCHFCHKIGHYKNNCRQYLALRNHPSYGDRLQQPANMQLIYDHLEDSVFAPKSCSYTSCTNSQCDGSACYTSFAYDEFEQAETYFNDNILSLVENVKLDRPADSQPPLTRSTYVAQQADWGESEDLHESSWGDQEQLWQEGTCVDEEESAQEDEATDGEDTENEESYLTQVEAGTGTQSHSEEEDDDTYE